MKNIKRLCALLLVLVCSLTGCTHSKIKMSYYDECGTDNGDLKYNNNLFYNNELILNKSVRGADPAVFQITDKNDPDYGKFVLTVTSGTYSFVAYISSDLVNWESIGPIMMADDDSNSAKSIVLFKNTWADEMIYDEQTGKYYLFFSATPRNIKSITGYENDKGSNTNGVFNSEYCDIPYVAVSDSFRGPFELIDFADGYSYTDGTPMKDKTSNVTEKAASAPITDESITDNGMGYAYFLRYSIFDPYKIWQAILNSKDENIKEIADFEPTKLLRSIDYHPFVDKNGDKYLYFTCNKDGKFSENNNTFVMGIKMKSWTEPDYSTLSRLTRYGYYEVDGSEKSTYEITAINEGAWMTEHNGKYYLTLSINGYTTTNYKVIQAVSDSPLGPFRKLTEDEGGVLLGADSIENVSGPGHHALVEVNNELYIVYHMHIDPSLGGSARYVAMNKVEWVKIKDKDNKDLEVMYTNGPTVDSLQPLPEFGSGYKNIAPSAKVTVKNLNKESKASYLNDKIIPISTGNNAGFTNKYIKSAVFDKKDTITLSFDDYKKVKSIMIYNSEWVEDAFYEVKSVEFDCIKDGKKIRKHIDNLKFNWDMNSNQKLSMCMGAAIAEFEEIEVKEIRITVEPATTKQIPIHSTEHKSRFAVGEIVVLGKE